MNDRAPAPLVYIVVVNWNGHENTIECLESLRRLDYPNFRITVIDNGSEARSVAALRAWDPALAILRHAENRGYTGGCNAGIGVALDAQADYIWLVNNDATVEPDTLARLVAAAEDDPSAGLASPLIDEGDGRRYCAALCDPALLTYTPTYDLATALAWQHARPEVIALIGAALLVRGSLVRQIGVLDDRFFAYWEDIDYSLRSASAGFCNILVPSALVHHRCKPFGTDPESIGLHYFYFMARNEVLLWRKHGSFPRVLKPIYWCLRRQLLLRTRMPGNPAASDAALAGFWDGLLGIGGRYDPSRRLPAPLRMLLRSRLALWLVRADARPRSAPRGMPIA